MIFKFGYTHNCVFRWCNQKFGYATSRDRFDQMCILHICSEPFTPSMLEAALIEKYHSTLDIKSFDFPPCTFYVIYNAPILAVSKLDGYLDYWLETFITQLFCLMLPVSKARPAIETSKQAGTQWVWKPQIGMPTCAMWYIDLLKRNRRRPRGPHAQVPCAVMNLTKGACEEDMLQKKHGRACVT